MFRTLKISVFFIALVLNYNANAKPVPPGAGDGDVPANILFLVDSSASMGNWIGTDGLGRATGVAYDSQGRILIGQNVRRSQGSVIRYTAGGDRDTTFRPIRRINNTGCAQETDRNRTINGRNFRAASTIKFVEGLTSTVINNENIIFANSRERRLYNFIFGFSENGRNCRFALGTPGGSVIHDFDIKIIGGTPYIFAFGRGWRSRSSFFKSCDMSTMRCETQTLPRNHIARFGNRFSVNNEGTIVYFSDSRNGHLIGHTLTRVGDAYNVGNEVRRCEDVNAPTLTNDIMHATGVEVSPDNSNTIYITSHLSHAVQRLELTDTTCTVVTSIGTGAASNLRNTGNANELSADEVNFNTPWGLHVSSTRILVATHRGFVDEFDEDLVTVANRDTAWLQQMGGPRVRRWDGVKEAIEAIVNDTTLTTGAHFGFGHWNAGENQGRRGPRGGQYCHRNADCTYYGGWGGITSANIGQIQTTETENADGTVTSTSTNLQTDSGVASNEHPNGTSTLCHVDACINVAVSSGGAGRIMDVFRPLGMAWGTDSHAFSQMAEDYFNDNNAGAQIVDPDSECQLNYIIVIGDGAMTNTGVLGAGGQTAARMRSLREKGIKSLYVAYGGGIAGDNLRRFHELARIGSSDLPAGTTATACIDDDDCERAIVALTPEDLKTALTAKIRQIIADRLAFTAPSITATIEEGGSLYQAQFSYEQFGEWQGTILRKGIDSKGNVTHELTEPENWSASDQIRAQSSRGNNADTRNIWSAIPGVTYPDGKTPDNFNTSNSTAIRGLFETFGYTLQDYHNASSDCEDIGNDSFLGDEVNGLILFMKGNDYFDYNGDCDVQQIRTHVMGDIYHSQLIEVGSPNANINFSDTNEEAYYRAKNGYQGFMTQQASRRNVLYAGSNSGMLHAIDAQTGDEIWGFVPPFIAAMLPQIINKDYDGAVGSDNTGGTNPIFGVDGSPVVHDLYINGYTLKDGVPEIDDNKSWRTIVFVPYGRGGPGFSVLDVTDPDLPIHMFSLYNDRINSRVLISDTNSQIREYEYNRTTSSLLDTSEGQQATDNTNDARDSDGNNEATPAQNLIAACQSTTDFRDNGTNSCYQGRTFHFPNISLDYGIDEEIPDGLLGAYRNVNGQSVPLIISSAKIIDDGSGGGLLRVTFSADEPSLTFNANPSDANSALSDNVVLTACLGAGGIDPAFDYSKLGETWSTPKIVRMPSSSDGSLDSDKYVAILGAGMSKGDKCGGSALFLVDLESHADGAPGRIHGAEINGGPITIVDTSPFGLNYGSQIIATPNGSDIQNAVPASPVVITPDTAPGIDWRGALVYINDLEGKITKINLSNNTKGFENNAFSEDVTELYDQTTLFRLDASDANGRYSYFSMDAGIGVSDGGFWLFGSTGNFTDLGNRRDTIDNILYGVQDKHYPYWKHLNGVTIPKATSTPALSSTTLSTTSTATASADLEIDPEFIKLAHKGANDAASNVGNATKCINVSGDDSGVNCPLSDTADAWVIHLEKDSDGNFLGIRTHRKASASPTLFKGIVYFPVYQPPPGTAKCNQGHAFICAADDECGTNSASQLKRATPGEVDNPSANACAYVREGVLSELVIFSDKLFANVAGPAEDEDTLFSILSIPGDVITNKGGWRDSSF